MADPIIFSIGGSIFVGFLGFRYWGFQHYPFWFQSGELGPDNPGDHGVAYEAITIPSARSRLAGWWVPAPADRLSGKAVLLCHGNQEALSDWAGAIARLHEAGHAVLAFDYSGFGQSTGRPSPCQLRQDVRAAFQELRQRAGAEDQLYLLGFSLGSAVLLESLAREELDISGMMLGGSYSSVRHLLPELTPIPAWATTLFPDLHNSARAIRANRQPTLLLHSRDDDVVPIRHARLLSEEAGPGTELLEVEGPSHTDFFRRPDSAYWDAVLDYIG